MIDAMIFRPARGVLFGLALWVVAGIAVNAEERSRPSVPQTIAATFQNREYRWLKEDEIVNVGRYMDYKYDERDLPFHLKRPGTNEAEKRRDHFERWQQNRRTKWMTPWMTSMQTMSIEDAADQCALPPRQWENPCYARFQLSGKQKVLVGIAASGHWFLGKKENDKEPQYQFIPDRDYTPMEQLRIQDAHWEPLGWVAGGEVQYYVFRDDIKWTGIWSPPEPLPKAFPDTPPNAQTPRHHVKAVTDQQQITTKVGQYGCFPGGILIEPKPSALPAAQRVVFDPQRRAFVVDGHWEFHPGLSEDECAHVARVAANKSDRRLAALSQVECLGVSHQSSVGRLLGEADLLLGRLAYGYNMEGHALPAKVCLPGYRNPVIAETDDYQRQPLATMVRHGKQMFLGLQPRLFLSFEGVQFISDVESRRFIPAAVELKIYYQVFRYNQFQEVEIAEGSPESHESHIVAAIQHLESNYQAYESRFQLLKRVRRVAELYAFLCWAYDTAAEVDVSRLNEGASPVIVPANHHFYSHIDEQSDWYQAYQQRLAACITMESACVDELPAKDRLWLTIGCLDHAARLNDAAALAVFRKLGVSLAQSLYPAGYSTSSKYPQAGNLMEFLRTQTSYHASAQEIYAGRVGYRTEKGEAALQTARTWYEQRAEVDPDFYLTYVALERICQKLGDDESAAAAHQKAVSASRPLLNEDDRDALAFLAEDHSRRHEYGKAAALRLAAAKLGEAQSQYLVYRVHQEIANTLHSERILQEADLWLWKASDSGQPHAMLELGRAYAQGAGRPRDLDQARIWLIRAGESGQVVAVEELKRLR